MRIVHPFLVLLIVLLLGITRAAPNNNEVEARKFIKDASDRYYSLFNRIGAQIYLSNYEEDFDTLLKNDETVKLLAQATVEIAEEAGDFDTAKITDSEVKEALLSLRKANLYVLGEEYFTSVKIHFASLNKLATDKEIEPYLGGANMPQQDDSLLAYYPDIQKIFQQSNDPEELKYYWESWREKNNIWAAVNFITIIEAFQKAAEKLDVPVLEFWYGCYNNKDFLNELEEVMEEIKPIYQQFHAYVRQELHRKYGSDVISPTGPIPDHLFQQVLEQAWTPGSVLENNFAHSELPPYDQFVKHLDAKQLIDEAERFYASLGFEALDAAFYNNQLKEQDEEGNMGDCKADVLDLTPKVYMKYCQKVDFRKFMQNHGYLSRVHYAQQKQELPSYFFKSYDLEYPVGEAVILSASTPKHLGTIGMAKNFSFTDKVLLNRLIRMGIHTLFNIPKFFVHTKIMNDILIGDVDLDSVNRHYWKLMEQYVGVEPPSDREEGAFDFPYNFYFDLEGNHQTKKLVSEVLGYQFYRAFCKRSLHEGPLHNCDFAGSLAVGGDLKAMMALGSTKPWHEVIAKVLPENPKLSAEALLEYYTPVQEWLKKKNQESGSKIGWNSTKKKVL